MAELGINYDLHKAGRDWGHDLSEFARNRVRWVRFPLRWNTSVEVFCVHARQRRIKTVAVVDRSALVVKGINAQASFEEAARAWRPRLVPELDALQVGNEEDHVSPSSWTMTQSDFGRLLRAFERERPRAELRLVAGGAVSGQPDWFRGVDLGPYMPAIHPYGRRPEQSWPSAGWGFGTVRELVDAYRGVVGPNREVWITEWGATVQEFGGNAGQRAEYVGRMATALQLSADLAVAIGFCAGSYMVPAYGWSLGDWEAFRRAARPVFEIGPGVLAAIARAGDEPRGNEQYTNDPLTGEALYSTTEGRDWRYRWTPQDGVRRARWEAG